jgi:deoxyribonuclease-1
VVIGSARGWVNDGVVDGSIPEYAREVIASLKGSAITNLEIKGNSASHIYHLPGCMNYDDISAQHTVWFQTKEQAENAGYRLADNCH